MKIRGQKTEVRGQIVFCASLCLFAAILGGCGIVRPQRGGTQTATLGGTAGPTIVSTTAPENPKTPSSTTVEKSTTREFVAAQPAAVAAGVQKSSGLLTRPDGAAKAPALPPFNSQLSTLNPQLVRETVTERATTELGTAQKDTAREVAARLGNMRGVMWVGVALLLIGPVVGWRLGWFTNGCIAGAVGLLLIILAQVVPGNEAWFGLGGLLLIPLVAYVWYQGHHTALAAPISAAPASAGSQGSTEPARPG